MRLIFPAVKAWRIRDWKRTRGDYLEFGVYESRSFIEPVIA
jgi:hypothetical protein